LKILQFGHKLILLSTTLLTIALGASAYSNYQLLKSKTESDLKASIHQISESISANISSWLNVRSNMIVSMAEGTADETDDTEIRKVLTQTRRSGKFSDTFVAYTNMNKFILHDPKINPPAGYDPTVRSWYELAKKSGGVAYTEPYIDATKLYLVISISAPVLQDDEFIGVAGCDLELSDIVDIINTVDYLQLGYAFLVTKGGKILSNPEEGVAGKMLGDYFDHTPNLSSEMVDVQIKGQEKLLSFIKISGLNEVDWYLGVVLDKDKAYASLSELKIQASIYVLISLLVTVILMGFLLRILMKPLRRLSDAIKDIAEGRGDLTQRLQSETHDEIGLMSLYFNEFIAKIHSSMINVKDSTKLLEDNIKQVRKNILSAETMYRDQNSSTTSVSSAIQQLNHAADEISLNAHRASNLTSSVHKNSDQSKLVLEDNIKNIEKLSSTVSESGERINYLNTHTENIDKILNVIKGISDQTNLLALNAAIEAARAGEQGKGFAVVANEVRVLARRTKDSTDEIHTMILNLKQGVDLVGESMIESANNTNLCVESAGIAGQKMVNIINSINDIDNENQSVASATEEQSMVINEVNREISRLTELNDDGEKNLTQILNACNALENQFNNLDKLIGIYKL